MKATTFFGRNWQRLVKNITRPYVKARQRAYQRRVEKAIQRPDPLPNLPEKDGVILFFAPEAGVPPHFAAQCVLARTLQDRGHRVYLTRCYRVFQRCPVMDSMQIPHDDPMKAQDQVCRMCAARFQQALDQYGLQSIDLRALLPRDRRQQMERAIASLPEDLLEFEFDGIPFGKLCAFDFTLAFKVSDFRHIDETRRNAWQQYLKSALLAYLMVDHACQVLPVRRLLHFNSYTMMLGARKAAQMHEVPTFDVSQIIHNNVDRRHIIVRPQVNRVYSLRQLETWEQVRDLALPPQRVAEVAGDLAVRLKGTGSHIYSPAKQTQIKDIRSEIGLSIDPNKKLLVAYTSSMDEVLAASLEAEATGYVEPDRPEPFDDQIQWLTQLVQWVGQRDDLQLAVRIHPREGRTKHRRIVSDHLQQLQQAFQTLPDGCRIVWPEEPVSSYDLGEVADVVLTSWSSIGLELARLGAPVLAAFNRPVNEPYDDFQQRAGDQAEYFEKLQRLLEQPPSIDTLTRAFRWYHHIIFSASLDFSDVIPAADHWELPAFRTSRQSDRLEKIVVDRQDTLQLNIEQAIHTQNAQSRTTERQALADQLQRLIHLLATGQACDSIPSLQLIDEQHIHAGGARGQVPESSASAWIRLDQREITYQHKSQRWQKYSPMIARLARLYGQAIGSIEHSQPAQKVA